MKLVFPKIVYYYNLLLKMKGYGMQHLRKVISMITCFCALSLALIPQITSAQMTSVQSVRNSLAQTLKSFLTIGSYDTDSLALQVQIVDGKAFIADGEDGLIILDVSNPQMPTLIGKYSQGYTTSVRVSNNIAYTLADNTLHILDVSMPDSPTLKGSITLDSQAKTINIVDHYAFIACIYNGIQIVDIQDPSNPTLITTFDTPDIATAVQVVGTTAYVADNTALLVLDISNIAAPSKITSLDMRATELTITGSTLYVAGSLEGLYIVDITTPTQPSTISHIDTSASGSANAVQVVGDIAYVADLVNDLQMVNVSNPASPKLLPNVAIPDYSADVRVIGDYIYVAARQAGLQILTQASNSVFIPLAQN